MLGESSVTLTLQAWCADAGVTAQVQCDLFERAKKSFQDQGIEIPFPYHNLVFKNALSG
jgi:small-conductance mechanosensitive channel